MVSSNPALPAPLSASKTRIDIKEIGALLPFADFLSRVAPRGKGAIPRKLGQLLISPQSVYFRTRHGGKIIIDPNCLDVFVSMRQSGNAWDYEDFRICHELTKDGDTIYDVGANVGYFSIEMLAIAANKVSVVAFEPHTALAQAIRASADAMGGGNLTVYNAMVGDFTGEASFYLAPSSIHGSAVADSGRPAVGTSQRAILSLDDLVASGAVPAPDVVKADIEGSEHLLFDGAKRVFREKAPHIFIEYLPEFDVDQRIRARIESLAADVPSYAVYGYPNLRVKSQFKNKLFLIEKPDDWSLVHGIVIRNTTRRPRDASMFGE